MKELLRKLLEAIKPEGIGLDKVYHAFLSFSSFICFCMAFEILSGAPKIALSGLLVLLLGIGKEYHDKVSEKGTPDIEDVFANTVGVLLGILLYILI
jgi:glycopeptide antibiotics resistance protein